MWSKPLFKSIRWRIAISYTVLILVAMGVLAIYSQFETDIVQLRRTILLFGGLGVIVAIVLATIIAERTTRPVRRLTQVAQKIAGGDLTARVIPTSRDEVGQLTHAFNDMAEQLRLQVNTLAEEQERLESILAHMAGGVLITDESGRVQLTNPAADTLLNTSNDKAVGTPFAQVVRHHHFIEAWQRCQQQETPQVEIVEIAKGAGWQHELFLQIIVTPLQEIGRDRAEHDYLPTLVILQDLTPIRRLETVRRDFISNISHELRTPLASLKAVVETLRDGALDDPPAAQRFLARAEHEVESLTQMVRELLELSRIESGKVPLRLAPTHIADVILPAVERLSTLAENEGVELIVDIPAGLPPTLADNTRVQQVVSNLVHNAIKFTPAGGTIHLIAQQKGHHIITQVRDTGSGIPASDLPRIFERFYKADRARSSGGTGLGLAIARHLIEAHNGHIWVKSKEGQGSTFYFSLPLANQ